MGKDNLTRNTRIWLSKRPQVAMGVEYSAAADFLGIESDQAAWVLPRIRYRNNAGRGGRRHGLATKQCAEVVEHGAYTITAEVNSSYAGRFFLRSVGGPVTSAQQGGSAAYLHSAKMLDELISRQLPPSTMISILGGADFRLPDMVIDRSRLEQTRNDVPRYSVDWLGSGDFNIPNGIDVRQVETATAAGTVGVSGAGNAQATVTAAGMPGSPRVVSFAVANNDTPALWAPKARAALAADPVVSQFFVVSGSGTSIVITARLAAADDATMNLALATGTATGITAAPTSTNTTAGAKALPEPVDQPCFDGNLTEVFWTDQFGLQTLTGSGCTILNWFIEKANNTKLNDRCAGDPTVTITDGSLTTTPSHVRKMKHGDESVVAQVTLLLDDNIPDWFTYATNDVLTDVTFRPRGPIIASTFRHSLAKIMPKARITDVSPTDFEGEAAMQMTLEAFWDDATNTALKVEVMNDETSNYD